MALGASIIFEEGHEHAFFWDDQERQRGHLQQQSENDVSFHLPSVIMRPANRRILLQGPDECNAMSLVMDLALSVASKEPCRCRVRPGIAESENSQPGRPNNNHYCEYCTAVTIISCERSEGTTFPLFCRPLENGSDHENASSSSSSSSPTRCSTNHYYCRPSNIQQYAMRRIHVRHVVQNLGDVLKYLLTVTCLPVEQQPLGGIFIEGLDRIIMPQGDSASTVIQLSQVAALLVDTAMCMKRTFGRTPIVLMSTSSSETPPNGNAQMTISSLLQSASSFWSPTILQITTTRMYGRWMKQQHAENVADEVAVAHWDVTCCTTSDNHQNEKQAEYCVMRNLDHEQRIVYACCQK